MDDAKPSETEGVTEAGALGQLFAPSSTLEVSRGRHGGRYQQGDRLTECCNGRSGGLADDVSGQGDLPRRRVRRTATGPTKMRGRPYRAAEVGQDDDLGTGIRSAS